MPTSATGIWKAERRQTGFTLLEIMVVLVLIGIITTFAVLSLRSRDERLSEEVQRLVAVLELNRQEALFQGEQRGAFFTETGYVLLQQDAEGHWLPLPAGGLAAARQLPSGFMFGLEVEGRPVSFAADTVPQVLWYSSGEATEFRLALYADGEKQPVVLSGDLAGRLSVAARP